MDRVVLKKNTSGNHFEAAGGIFCVRNYKLNMHFRLQSFFFFSAFFSFAIPFFFGLLKLAKPTAVTPASNTRATRSFFIADNLEREVTENFEYAGQGIDKRLYSVRQSGSRAVKQSLVANFNKKQQLRAVPQLLFSG